MTGMPTKFAIVGAVMAGLTAPSFAQATSGNEVETLKAELAALKSQVKNMSQAQNENWLNERRAEEVKGLIREVLSDADTRATLLQDGAVAGHDGKNFFLSNADGSFLMNVGGQLQFRWIVNDQDDRADETDAGFQFRRAKLKFGGHIADPRLTYELLLGTNRANGDVVLEDAVIGYKISDSLAVKAGSFKLPFLRQELTSSSRQLAVERGSVTEYFTLNRAEQIQLTYSQDDFKLTGSISDGANSGYSDYAADTVEYALTARADVKLAGEWGQAKDITAWEGEDLAVFVGGAAHYEAGDAQNGGTANYLGWTIDGSVEQNGWSLFASLNGATIDPDAGSDRDPLGFLVEGAYNMNDKLQPFVRWEWLDDDAAGTDDLEILTAGVNYYLNGHNAKFTADVVWIYDGDDPAGNPFGANELSSGLGLASFASDEDQLALRAQFQLLF